MKRKYIKYIISIIVILFIFILLKVIIFGPITIGKYNKFKSDDLKNCLNIKDVGSDYSGQIRCIKYKFYYEVGNHVREPNYIYEALVDIDTLTKDLIRYIYIVENKSLIHLYIEKNNHPFSSDSVIYPYALSIKSFDYSSENKNELIKILKNVEADF